jgi:hypothetical protein
MKPKGSGESGSGFKSGTTSLVIQKFMSGGVRKVSARGELLGSQLPLRPLLKENAQYGVRGESGWGVARLTQQRNAMGGVGSHKVPSWELLSSLQLLCAGARRPHRDRDTAQAPTARNGQWLKLHRAPDDLMQPLDMGQYGPIALAFL